MTRRIKKRSNPAIHTNRLLPSKADAVALGLAVEERFLILCERYERTRGVQIEIPPELDRSMFHWRSMRVRHKKGDFRNTPDEWRATKRIAQWTVDVNNNLCGQPAHVVPMAD